MRNVDSTATFRSEPGHAGSEVHEKYELTGGTGCEPALLEPRAHTLRHSTLRGDQVLQIHGPGGVPLQAGE